jgi:hypothetical protein
VEKGTTIGQVCQPLKINIIETLEPQEYILDSSITVDDVEFAAALAKINEGHVLISKLAQNYNEIIALETK